MTPEEQIAERRKSIPSVYKGIYDKAIKGKGYKNAVHAFCLECTCWQREEVKMCQSPACPLYSVRPYKP